jgi:excisionase family DNA binding protein
MRSNFEPSFAIDPQRSFERLLDCEETARLLHLHPKTVERLAREGRMPAYKVGKRWLFRASEIDQWMSSLVDFSRRSVPRGQEKTP